MKQDTQQIAICLGDHADDNDYSEILSDAPELNEAMDAHVKELRIKKIEVFRHEKNMAIIEGGKFAAALFVSDLQKA